jgi:choline dehydrogenase-like flavoprotein
MSASPRSGVVDADSRVHGVSNLFVLGSSAFPTGGYANPLLTVLALAVRLGDLLRRDLMTSPTVR